ncbi:MAG: DUF362 domain-containing protein, partial [Deltaproteobacteria bacterium]|nr:DUF362 domain-containing protein [Deltaproteobacteria bacterium]
PKVIEALVRYFRKRKNDVVIAEGTGIFGTDQEFERLLHATLYDRIRDRLGVPIINLEQVEREKVPWRFGFIRLPKLLRDYEYINVPTMKTHLQTQVSLGLKNQKGLLPMETKKRFHKKDLHSRIYELSKVVQPALTLMDALYCIEGTGPTGPPVGEVKRMDMLMAGKDLMAVDNVCVRIMGFDIKEIKHLRPVKDIRVIGEKISDVRSDFKKPMAAFSLDRFEVHMDERACTMCTVSFYKTLSKILNTPELHQELSKRKDLKRIKVILGPGDPPSDLGTCALCVGDCAASLAKKNHLPHIKGCHPDFRDIVNFFFPGYYGDQEMR